MIADNVQYNDLLCSQGQSRVPIQYAFNNARAFQLLTVLLTSYDRRTSSYYYHTNGEKNCKFSSTKLLQLTVSTYVLLYGLMEECKFLLVVVVVILYTSYAHIPASSDPLPLVRILPIFHVYQERERERERFACNA